MIMVNNNFWLDIPNIATALVGQNYKFFAKGKLTKVPILSESLTVERHNMGQPRIKEESIDGTNMRLLGVKLANFTQEGSIFNMFLLQ